MRWLPGELAVCRMDPASEPPPVSSGESFYSVTKTASELSVVCDASLVPAGAAAETGWRGIALAGPIPFSVTGVLASLVGPLAAARISVFAIATYDTDYVLVRVADAPRAKEVLEEEGFVFDGAPPA